MEYRLGCLLELETDEGHIGFGESWVNYPAWALEERAATLKAVSDRILGEDPRAPKSIMRRLQSEFRVLARQWGAPGPIAQALSAVDLALWDLAGQIANVPVYRLHGVAVRPLTVYASGLGPKNVEAQCTEAMAQGFTAAKIKVGFTPDTDLQNARIARKILGDRPLMLDANQGWTQAQAETMLRKLAFYNPYWIEEPLLADDWHSYQSLDSTGIPLALGENLYDQQFEQALSLSPRWLQPDIAKVGGLSKALSIHEMAAYHNLSTIPHVFGTGLSVVIAAHFALIAHSPWLELDLNPNPLRQELLTEPLNVRDGHLLLNEKSGWGYQPDRGALQKFSWKQPESRSH